MTLVKICGINDPIAFDTAVEAGADWVGFVFFPPSPRYVTPDTAAALSARIVGGPPRVGLFVRPDIPAIARVLDVVRLDVLQICPPSGLGSACQSGEPSRSAVRLIFRPIRAAPIACCWSPSHRSVRTGLVGTQRRSIGEFSGIGRPWCLGCWQVA
jgi:hypothetical protein